MVAVWIKYSKSCISRHVCVPTFLGYPALVCITQLHQFSTWINCLFIPVYFYFLVSWQRPDIHALDSGVLRMLSHHPVPHRWASGVTPPCASQMSRRRTLCHWGNRTRLSFFLISMNLGSSTASESRPVLISMWQFPPVRPSPSLYIAFRFCVCVCVCVIGC